MIGFGDTNLPNFTQTMTTISIINDERIIQTISCRENSNSHSAILITLSQPKLNRLTFHYLTHHPPPMLIPNPLLPLLPKPLIQLYVSFLNPSHALTHHRQDLEYPGQRMSTEGEPSVAQADLQTVPPSLFLEFQAPSRCCHLLIDLLKGSTLGKIWIFLSRKLRNFPSSSNLLFSFCCEIWSCNGIFCFILKCKNGVAQDHFMVG